MESLPRKELHKSLAKNLILPLSLLVLAGCGFSINHPASLDSSPGTTAAVNSAVPIEGHVGGDEWQVRNASVQLYAMGTTGPASPASPLLTQPVSTDSNGNFRITEAYSCPSPTSQLYLVASGGTPVPGPVTDNQAIALMTMLGPCNGMSSSKSYPMNEVTTVGSVWPLSPYMASATQLGSNPNDQSLTAALTLVNQLVNLQQGISPGMGVPAGEAVQTAKLYTIANDFHSCVLSAGGEAGDGSACGQLFGVATASGSVAPKNTIDAALRLAQASQLNLEGLFQMVPGNAIYQPVLLAPPASWDLKLIAIPEPPSFSPPAGSYSLGQQIVLNTTAPGAAIHYTTDGSQPSSYSAVYEGPLVLSSTETINAVSMTEEISSSTATAAFSPRAPKNLEVTPSQVSLSPSQSQSFTASVPGSRSPSVTWSVSPAVGTISAAGLYTAPASITGAQTVTVTAVSAGNSAESAHAIVSLTPPAAVKVTVSPASASLSSSQSQQFTATVTGTSNTNVTWSLNPAVGTISAAGLYTAPASITGAQTVTITATSAGNSAESAHAIVSLTPPAAVKVTVSPASASLSSSQSQQFTATVTGTSNTNVTWSVNPAVGTISAAGLYTAPASVTGAQTVTITATSAGDSAESAHAIVSLTPPAAVKVTVSPASASLSSSQSQQFTATVTGTSNTNVTWSLNPAVGTISAAGLYTAPASITGAQTVTITAVSAGNSAESAQAIVSLTPPAAVKVTVSPASASLSSSQSQQFTATVTGTSNTNVTWSLNPAVGTISAAGLYTAPASVASAQTVSVTATSSASPGIAATATVTTIAGTGSSTGKTYYLATAAAGGKDSNSGLLATAPWLTPNHALNCGDVIIAAASTSYSSGNFISGNWGTVSCPAANNVAWLKCAQFDACKITATAGQPGLYVDKSYWGVQGWEITASNSTSSFCFGAAPNYLTPVTIHHIIFANNVANGCQQGGFTTFNSGKTASVDYVSIIGNIAYNAAQNGAECFSGISIYQPIQSDSLSGTHIYVAGNFSYGNVDANPCAGGIPTDGEGLIFDTFDGDQGGLSSYAAQAIADNNIFVGNGGRGLQVGNNSVGAGPFATIYLRNNTLWGNNGDRNQNTNAICGELSLFRTVNTSASSNLAETNEVTGCGENPIYAFYVWGGNGTDEVSQNWGYAVSGTTSSGSYNSPGFSFQANNTFGEDAHFANPVTPGSPNCSGSSSVPACMAAVIANFKPTNTAAAGFGYQPPSSTPVYDPLFPQWLCTTSLPAGLITVGCQSAP